MRKPAVVVTAAVSAVLVGGIMVATTAGAEEAPAKPAAPSMVLPDMPVIPQLPADVGVPPITGLPAVPGHPAAGAAQGAHTAGAVVPARPGDVADPAKPAADQPAVPGVVPPAARPVGAAARPAPASVAAAEPGPVREDQADEEPAADKPARGGGSNTFSAAQRDVTVAQAMSTDPRGSVQTQALNLVNENRRRGGCDNLTVDRRLIVAANRHAAEMARRGYFAHEDTRGERAGDRVQDAGYRWSRYGENIARGQDSVFEVVNGWMRSPEHRENIMDCGLREVGVGLAFAADRTPYWVQDFATPQ
ncbi:hypothetical protein DMB66_36045 [Actinoplanes sp. ATCC 53533]|uniref:CAP domain-containing protein n=1 Tax=Actinoplanes sp. ATCC 53533 TaxID=1288362 RepID=UPI000F7A8F0B|nr:CAP domain-containing protein [Actinoplanes sp. ATCC 53533]RSM55710.1 hypothetical protein DMB66_36045 [Actinoplanes sp. ATCC 53533]